MLEVFNNLFMHVAEEMGIVLEHTAHSVNIKERLDFSCALFAADGSLIANAPHIPVHLGSMGDSVESILRSKKLAPGDAYLLNSPYNGGTHLPDLTVVTPVFDPRGRRLRYFVASRAHHADVGGSTPGSMPPSSRTIDEEGVLLDGVQVVAGGELLEARGARAARARPFPARNPDQNVADLKAQLAANARGVVELERLVARFGIRTVERYMRHVKSNAAACVRAAIAACATAASAWSSTAASASASRSRRRRATARHRRLHGHVAGQRRQLQRADVDRARGRAVRVSDAGPREHSAERRLPRAADDRAARTLPARPAAPSRRRGRQRRDVAVHRRMRCSARSTRAPAAKAR